MSLLVTAGKTLRVTARMSLHVAAVLSLRVTTGRSEEVVGVGQNLRFISSQAGLQLLNVLVTLPLYHRSFNYHTDHGKV